MQYDMHYYGTYTLAAAAGFAQEDAETIAYAAQNVDDQNATALGIADDGSALLKVSTAHHPLDAGRRALLPADNLNNDARLVWLPFIFFKSTRGAFTKRCFAIDKLRNKAFFTLWYGMR